MDEQDWKNFYIPRYQNRPQFLQVVIDYTAVSSERSPPRGLPQEVSPERSPPTKSAISWTIVLGESQKDAKIAEHRTVVRRAFLIIFNFAF